MIKRMNKVTALMVAAAAVVSLVPATTASASERLATKEGNITSAIAFDGGKYVFDGYKSDSDDSTVYFNNGSKDTAVVDADDYTFSATKYGTKYVQVNDGDHYLLDLSTGKINTDETVEDLQDNLLTKLTSKFKKLDRYESGTLSLGLATSLNTAFGDVWYEYEVTTSAACYGVATQDGKYMDVSNVANMSFYDSARNKMVKVEEFDKASDNVVVNLASKPELLAQDKDNLYFKTTVTVSGLTGVENGTRYFIQKVSKATGDAKDEALLPKTVTSYELSADVSIYDNGDSVDANTALTASGVVAINAIDGSLYVTKSTKTNVEVTKLDLKKVKVDSKIATTKKADIYTIVKDDSADQDIAGVDGYSIDANGSTWAINKGKIYKFDKLDVKEVYTCDRSLNSINVYNEGSLIAWDASGEVYTTVQEGKEVAVTPAQTGWVKTDAGWTFYDTLGKQVTAKWVNDAGVWYMIKADGIMATGWYNDNGTWYYLKSSGAMATGWLNDNGTWYYLNASGAMLANTTVDGYVLGANGAWVK